jgi:predicted nucleotidyltransferase
MRISKEQKNILVQSALKFFGENANIWLFGSRCDDTKKGGDIDLYIETDLEIGTVNAKLGFLGVLQDALGEQKIDILVRSRSKPMTAIQEIAKDSGILLN